MTRSRLLAIAERRALLKARALAERETLAALAARTDGAGRLAGNVLATGRRVLEEIRHQPLLVVAGAALLVALRPRRAFKWLLEGWSLWRMYRGAQRWWQRLAAGAAEAPRA
jgi:hypothetical protein